MTSNTFRIGVDGGGTKTACILVDGQGAIAARRAGPGCNPSIEGSEGARRILREALEALVPKGASVEATLLCMAGAPEFWRETAASITGMGRVASAPDSLPVLEAATRGGAGLVLHAGTGSFVAARTAGGNPANLLDGAHYAGGLGWKLGDPGSGYDVGRRAAVRGLLELQGWAPPSPLGTALRIHTRLPDAEAITRHLYREAAAPADLATLAPAILATAEGGDPVARQLVIDSAGELLDLAIAVGSRLFGGAAGVRAGLSGHILGYGFVREALAKRSPFPLFPVADSPEEGLRMLVARWKP